MQISHNAEDVELKWVAAEKDASVEVVKFDKELKREKDINEGKILDDNTNRKERFIWPLSVSLPVDKRGEMETSGDAEVVELDKIASEIDASGKEVELGDEAE